MPDQRYLVTSVPVTSGDERWDVTDIKYGRWEGSRTSRWQATRYATQLERRVLAEIPASVITPAVLAQIATHEFPGPAVMGRELHLIDSGFYLVTYFRRDRRVWMNLRQISRDQAHLLEAAAERVNEKSP